MKVIKLAIPIIADLAGARAYDSGMVYRVSKNCFRVSCIDDTLLNNTFTGALLLLSDGESDMDLLPELVKESFYVPTEFDEQKLSPSIFRCFNHIYVEK